MKSQQLYSRPSFIRLLCKQTTFTAGYLRLHSSLAAGFEGVLSPFPLWRTGWGALRPHLKVIDPSIITDSELCIVLLRVMGNTSNFDPEAKIFTLDYLPWQFYGPAMGNLLIWIKSSVLLEVPLFNGLTFYPWNYCFDFPLTLAKN